MNFMVFSSSSEPAAPARDALAGAAGSGELRRQSRDVHDGPDLDGAVAGRWNPRCDRDRLIPVLGLDQVVAAEILPRLRERAIGQHRLTVAHADAGRRRDRVQRAGAQVMPARREILAELGLQEEAPETETEESNEETAGQRRAALVPQPARE